MIALFRYLLILTVAGIVYGPGQAAAQPDRPPNVLFISVDDLNG